MSRGLICELSPSATTGFVWRGSAADMLTQCPQCHTVFRLAPTLLEAAQGRVRCGRCNAVFDAATDLPGRLPIVEPADGLPETPTEDDTPSEFQLSEEE